MPKPAKPQHECSSCGLMVDNERLTVKRVLFSRFGTSGRWLRSRTVAWLCETCRDGDPTWNQKSRVQSPGLTQ